MSRDALTEWIGADAARVLDEARAALGELVLLSLRVDPGGPIAANAKLVHEHVDEFFLLVVVGEVKSGKSSFINALLGEKIQEEGPLPVTDRIFVLRHGESRRDDVRAEFVVERSVENDLLRLFHVVDTPGTNSIVRQHQTITESFIPKADLTLFVTSIDRPFSESEHQFLGFVNEKWRRKVIFVLTKVDAREPEDVPQVVDYIRENCRRFFQFEPRVFPVSARDAIRARKSGDEQAFERSGIPELRRFLLSNVARAERVQLKLSSPVEGGLALLQDVVKETARQRERLEADFRALNDLDAQVRQKAVELRERLNAHVVRLYDHLREYERRGRAFFEEVIQVRHFGLLRDPQAFRRRFEAEVVADLKDRIDETMHAATDWLMKEQIGLFERALRFLTEHLKSGDYQRRVAAPEPKDQGFEYHRDQLVAAIQAAWQREVKRADVQAECDRVLEQAYRGILAQLGVQAGAVGVGALLVAILSGVALDVTGVLAASVLFATGFVILPRRKRQLIHQFTLKVDQLIREFKAALVSEFDREIEVSIGRLQSAYEPYLTFYRAEVARLEAAAEAERTLQLRLLQLRDSIAAVAKATPGAPIATDPTDRPPEHRP